MNSMKYPFKTKKQDIKKYLFELKESCIIEHEDNWFKEKSHTKLYPISTNPRCANNLSYVRQEWNFKLGLDRRMQHCNITLYIGFFFGRE